MQEILENKPVMVETQSKEDIKKELENELKKDLKEDHLPPRSIKLNDGTVISNLKINYQNLFDFQNSYEASKDLIAALVKKQTFELECMIQLIYVGYLGSNPTPKMEYKEFIQKIDFDFTRDMKLFEELSGKKVESKN